jgi:hypothetical protein
MSELELYLITRLDEIKTLLFIVSVFFSITSIVYFLLKWDDDIDDTTIFEKRSRRFFVAAVISAVLFIATPKTEEMVIIKVIPKVIKNEQVQKLPTNLLKFINSWLEKNINQDANKNYRIKENTNETDEN